MNYPTNFPVSKRIYQLVDGTYDGIFLNNIIGNGVSDMFAYIPDNLFAGDSFLYSKFNQSAGTFEEWGTRASSTTSPSNVPDIPEPSTFLLLGSGLGYWLLRKKKLPNFS